MCSPLEIDDGQIVGNALTAIVDTEVTYTCDQNFVLMGNERRMCQADGQWTGSNPTCVGKNLGWITCANWL